MTAWMRTLHKWVALVLALQFVAWMASGLALSLIDHDAAAGGTHRARHEAAAKPWPAGLLAPAQLLREPGRAVQRVESQWLLDRPVYRLTDDAGTWLVDAATGARRTIDADAARAIARHDYAGAATPGTPERLDAAPREAIDHAPPLWRVRFADDVDTTLYVSAVDGRILERRNRASRWFEFFWMLHTMDYSGRGDFNHPLVVGSAFAALWVALTGVWLLFAPLRRRRVPARVPG